MTKQLPGQLAPPMRIVRGREAVLAWNDKLVDLSRRYGQTGAMDHLEYHLGRRAFARKNPALVLTMDANANGAETPEAAVLLYEHRIGSVGCGLFSADYHGAVRTVIAPEADRARTAFAACSALLKRGALLVHASYEGEHPPAGTAGVASPLKGHALQWTTIQRPISGYLRLESTVDATLANLGRHTRRNLRYYRRRAETNLGVQFVPRVEMSLEQFLELNRSSMNPIAENLATDQYISMAHLKHPLFAGVRDAQGQWLSLIGGRRHEGTTEVLWQMNRAGFERHSLSTVMRAYLLESEVAEGTTKLAFEGGTRHSMKYSFVNASVVDILVRRQGMRAWALRRFAESLFPERSFLRDSLADRELIWTPWRHTG